MEVASLGRASLEIVAVLATQAELNRSNWANPSLLTAEAGRFLCVPSGTAALIRHAAASFYGVTVPSVASRVQPAVTQAISKYGFSSMGFHESFATKSVHASGAGITVGNCLVMLSTSKTGGLYNHILGEELSETSPSKPLFESPQ